MKKRLIGILCAAGMGVGSLGSTRDINSEECKQIAEKCRKQSEEILEITRQDLKPSEENPVLKKEMERMEVLYDQLCWRADFITIQNLIDATKEYEPEEGLDYDFDKDVKSFIKSRFDLPPYTERQYVSKRYYPTEERRKDRSKWDKNGDGYPDPDFIVKFYDTDNDGKAELLAWHVVHDLYFDEEKGLVEVVEERPYTVKFIDEDIAKIMYHEPGIDAYFPYPAKDPYKFELDPYEVPFPEDEG